MGRQGVWLGVLCLWGCQESVRDRLDLDLGDLLILISVSPTGRIVDTQAAWGSDSLPDVDARPTDRAYAAVLRPSDWVGPGGEALDPQALRQLRVGPGPMPAAGCGRCLFEAMTPPMIVHPGDVCPVPPFVEWQPLAGASPVDFEARPFISFPGACPCPTEVVPESAAERSFVLVDPPGFWQAEAYAQADDGRVGLFAENQSALFATDGAKSESRELFGGPVLAAAGAPDGSFWVFSHEAGGAAQARLDRIGLRDGQLVITERWPAQPVRPVLARRLGAAAYFAGQDTNEDPLVVTCDLDADVTRCASIEDRIFGRDGESFLDVVRLQDGTFLIVLGRGFVVIERVLVPADRPASETRDEVSGSFRTASGSPVAWWRQSVPFEAIDPALAGADLLGAAAFGPDLLLCAFKSGRTHFLRAVFDPDSARTGAAPRYTDLGAQSGRCQHLATAADGSGAVRATLSSGVFQISTQGRIQAFRAPGFPKVARVQSEVPDWSLLIGPAGEVSRQQVGLPPESVHPGPQPVRPIVAVLGGVGAHFVVDTQRIRRAVARDDAVTLSPYAELAAGTGTITAAALGPEGQIWLATRPPALFEVPVGGGSPQPLRVPGVEEVGGFSELRAVAPGKWIAIGADHQAYVVDDQVRTPALIVDDPSTIAVELRRPDARVQALAESQGVAWVGASGMEAYRVHPYSDPPRLERLAFNRPTQQQFRIDSGRTPPALSALLATCADRVYFAASGDTDSVEERGLLWLLAPEVSFQVPPVAEGPPAFGGLSLRDVVQGTSLTAIHSGAPIAVLPGPERLDLLFAGEPLAPNGSIHGLGAKLRSRLADRPTGGASDGRTVLVGTERGRLYLQVPASAP